MYTRVCVLTQVSGIVHIFYFRLKADATVNQLPYNNLQGELFLALRDKEAAKWFPSVLLPSPPFASFCSYTDPAQYQYLQRNSPCIWLHQEGYLLPTASHPQEVADSSIPRRKGKDLGLITLQLSAENRFSIRHLSYHNIPKSLISCTLNGKPKPFF